MGTEVIWELVCLRVGVLVLYVALNIRNEPCGFLYVSRRIGGFCRYGDVVYV